MISKSISANVFKVVEVQFRMHGKNRLMTPMFIIYGQIGPALYSKGHEFHNFCIGLHVHVPLQPCTYLFPYMSGSREEIFEYVVIVAYLSLSPRGGKVTAFTI